MYWIAYDKILNWLSFFSLWSLLLFSLFLFLLSPFPSFFLFFLFSSLLSLLSPPPPPLPSLFCHQKANYLIDRIGRKYLLMLGSYIMLGAVVVSMCVWIKKCYKMTILVLCVHRCVHVFTLLYLLLLGSYIMLGL